MNPIEHAMQSVMSGHEQVKYDPSRPQFHLLPPSMWMNDPNGLIYYNNKYHVFYQHNPYKPKWGAICWGHIESSDLLHWTHLPIALAPDKEHGEKHCFSGCCVDHQGIPTIFYTSIKSLLDAVYGGQIWIATSDSDLIQWRRHPNNPIMDKSVHQKRVLHWRDPYIWREDDKWNMVIGGQLTHPKRGAVFYYTSKDLQYWAYEGILGEGDPEIHKTPWECPNLLKWTSNSILIISPMNKVQYSFQNRELKGNNYEKWHVFDHGKAFYAPQSMRYPQNEDRFLLWGWIKGGGHTSQWNGCFSLPRVLEIEENTLRIQPCPELEKLRQNRRVFNNQSAIFDFRNGCGEFIMKFSSDKNCSIQIYQNPDSKFTITYHPSSKSIQMGKETAFLQFPQTETILHGFIDRSVIELFINYKECFTSRFYPTAYTDMTVDCRVPGMDLISLKVWELNPIIQNYASN